MRDFNQYVIETDMIKEMIIEINQAGVDKEDKHTFMEVFNIYRDYIRQCDCCGNLMAEGHFIDECYEYYCSDECLNKSITKEEQEELYENDLLFYTEWI